MNVNYKINAKNVNKIQLVLQYQEVILVLLL